MMQLTTFGASVSLSTRLMYKRLIFCAAARAVTLSHPLILQQALLAMRPGEPIDERAVDARPRAVAFAVERNDQLPPAALPDVRS